MFITLTRLNYDEYGHYVDEESVAINTNAIRYVTDNGDGAIFVHVDRGDAFVARGTVSTFADVVGAKSHPCF